MTSTIENDSVMTSESATKAGAKALKKLKAFKGNHHIAVGLSGGVDSSLTAALFLQAGWKVEGITLWLMSGKGSCCSEGLIDASGLCEQLNIKHHVLDTRTTFQSEIVEKVIEGYKMGITPLPCSECNKSVKFSSMINWANKQQGESKYIATGHYARISYSNQNDTIEPPLPGDSKGRNKLLRGIDLKKDQSYFLYDLSQEVLGQIIFPLGDLTKEDTRKEAQKLGLKTAKKAESQDLCLAEHHGTMKAFIDNYLPPRMGNIILQDGTIVGKHDGIEHFTIGQRKGLGISWSEPLHVISLDAENNQVVVATRQESGISKCIVGKINWVSINPPNRPINANVQIRYRAKPIEAQIIPTEPNKTDIDAMRPYRCEIIFKEKQFSVTPGQAAVFYAGNYLLGGGLIDLF